MNRLLTTFLFVIWFCLKIMSQNAMRIHYKNGTFYDTPIEFVDSVIFVDKESEQQDANLVREWFWGNKENGYYEVLSFNEDKTYTAYDYYLDYGFDTWTYGTYFVNGSMLNLRSYGYGYQRVYRWFITALTGNALEVMTQMGLFVYYRIMPEIYSLKVGEESYACQNGDSYVFTDGVRVSDNDGKLKGISEGTTYILKYNANSELIMAYKVVVCT